MVIEAYESDCCAMSSGAIDHFALNVKDIDAVFAWAAAAGLKTEDQQVNYLPFFDRGVRFFSVTGPNAERVEFNQII